MVWISSTSPTRADVASLLAVPRSLDDQLTVERLSAIRTGKRVDAGRPSARLEPRDRRLRRAGQLGQLLLRQAECLALLDDLLRDLREEPALVGIDVGEALANLSNASGLISHQCYNSKQAMDWFLIIVGLSAALMTIGPAAFVAVWATRRTLMWATLAATASAAGLIWWIELYRVFTGVGDLDGIFDCDPDCSTSQNTATNILSYFPMAMGAVLLVAVVAAGIGRLGRPSPT